MKMFVPFISLLLAVILLFGGCTAPTNDPTTAPTDTAETQMPTKETTQPIPSETEEDDDSVAVESLLGANDLCMQTVSTEYHPYDFNAKLYTYRFYSKASGDLLVIENVITQILEDFDGDGVVELFAQVFAEKQYVLYDLVNGQIITESYDLVPDVVLDYDMLLDAEEYYLYEERWVWFLKDPNTYVKEVAKRPEDRLYAICPNGIIPAYTEEAQINAAIGKLNTLLDGTPTDYEKKIIYKLLNTIQLSYLPQLTPGADLNYGRLLEQWCATTEMSTEYYKCLQQISDVFDGDPMAFLKGIATVDPSTLSKETAPVISWLAQTNYLYNEAAFRTVVNRLNANANSDEEKVRAALFQAELDAQTEPAIYAEKLLSGEPAALWRGFFYDPVKTLNVLGSCKEEQLKYLGQNLWGSSEQWAKKLLDKGYDAVNGVLAEKPAGTLKDVAYKFLIHLEWQGGYRDTYVPGMTFDYQRLFEKSLYSDGALATMCFGQMFDVFEADPESFMKALSQGNWNTETIAMQFAHRYQADSEYLEILNSLLENPDTAESARAFIEASENLKK